MVGMVRKAAPYFLERLHGLASHPLVGETRGVGLIGAIEIVREKEKKEHFPVADLIPMAASQAAFKAGVISRPVNNALCLCPPLIIKPAEIDELFDGIKTGLDAALAAAREKGHQIA